MTIVSVTPLPLGRDSRTLKQAMTLARMGYRSIVVADRRRWDLDPGRPPEFPPSQSMGEEDAQPRPRRARSWLRFDRLPAVAQAPVFFYWLLRYCRRYVWQVFPRLPRASLYCVHEFSSFPAVWMAARMAGAPIVYDAHDFYTRIEEVQQRSSFDRRFILPFQQMLERVCMRRADSVLTVSNGLAELISQEYGVKPIVVRNCHDSRLDQPVKQDIRRALDLNDGDFLVVTIGNCKKGQALLCALDAMAKLPVFVHLAFIGDGYDIYTEEIANHHVTDRVHLVGFVPSTKLIPFVRTANASLILYYQRSVNYRVALPNGFFQSLAGELPMLYPYLPEMAAVMKKGHAGICIDAQDPSSIVLAVERLLEDRDAAGTASVRRQLCTQWAWEEEERLFADELRRCLGNTLLALHAARERAD